MDGLDEATPAERRATLAALVQIGANRAILASRPAAYSGAELSGWQVCEAQRLDSAERQTLVAQVFATFPAADMPDQTDLITALDVRPDLLTWSSNPLLLTLIATQYARDRRLPDNRARIYEFAVEDMQRQRALTARRLLTQREFDRLLRHLALRMFEARQVVVTDDEILAILRRLDPTLTPAIVDELRDRAGVFLEQTRGWGFVHLTFQEYLAACALADLEASARCEIVTRRSLSARWEQVFLLLVSRLDLLERHAATDTLILDLIAADRQRVPILGTRDPAHLALRRATRCQIERPDDPRARRPIRPLKCAWRPIWRRALRRVIYEGQVYANYFEFFNDGGFPYDVPAIPIEALRALEADPITNSVRIPPERVIWPTAIMVGIGMLAMLVGGVVVAIPPLAGSAFGQWWRANLPIIMLVAISLLILVRLLFHWLYRSTLRLSALLAPLNLELTPSWAIGDANLYRLIVAETLEGKMLSHLRATDADIVHALVPLLSAMKRDDWRVRQAAAQALGTLADSLGVSGVPLIARNVARSPRWRALWIAGGLTFLTDAVVLALMSAAQIANRWPDLWHSIRSALPALGALGWVFSLVASWQVLLILVGYTKSFYIGALRRGTRPPVIKGVRANDLRLSRQSETASTLDLL